MIGEPAEKRDFRDYVRPVLRRWWLIVLIVPVVTVGTYYYYDHKPKSYSATAELFIQPSPVSRLLNGGESRFSNEANAQNLTLLIETRQVALAAEKVISRTGKQRPPGGISASRLPESNFILINAGSSTPEGAATLANAYAKAFIEIQDGELHSEAAKTLQLAEQQLAETPKISETLPKRLALEEQIQQLGLVSSQAKGAAGIRVIEKAFPVDAPIDHDPTSHAIFAFVLSLMLAIGAAFGLEYLNRKITSVEDVEEIFAAPVIAELPKVGSPTPKDGDGGATMERRLHQPFNRLQMNLDLLADRQGLRTILIVSATPNEGKSMVTRNLGLAYREAGRNVAVLDADFRKATLGRLLASEEGPGLTDVLAGRASFGQAIQEVIVQAPQNGNGAEPAAVMTQVHGLPGRTPAHGDLAVVPAGGHHNDLAATLASGGMRATLQTAIGLYDRVLIDSSPLLATADVLPLLSEVDGVLIVTRLGLSTRDSTRRMLRQLSRIPSINVVGVVVNGIPSRVHRTRAYGSYYG